MNILVLLVISVIVVPAFPKPTQNSYEDEYYRDENEYYLHPDYYYEPNPHGTGDEEGADDLYTLEYRTGDDIVEGDIIKRTFLIPINALKDRRARWPNDTVLYSLDPRFTSREKRLMEEAWDEIRNQTCVKIRKVTISERRSKHYVMIRKTDPSAGCSSDVGFLGWVDNSPQVINYAPACLQRKGSILHEMLHTIGLYHEHARTDRDAYITINWSNIEEDEWENFEKRRSSEVRTYGTDYDYKSVMHYNSKAFCLNCRIPTIVPKKRGAKIGQRTRLSRLDAEKLNSMYGCPRRMQYKTV